jgi:molecular chaperone DnaJ
MHEINPWNILGLPPNASLNEIKKAYRRLLKEKHPDTSQKISKYDISHIKWAYNCILTKSSPLICEKSHEIFEGDDILDIQNAVEDGIFLFFDVSMEDAFYGRTITINLPDKEDFCPQCEGRGKVSGPGEKICSNCHGKGYLNLQWGDEVMKIMCKECAGIGKINLPFCPRCNGRGRVLITKNVSINLPRGVKNGAVLKIPNFSGKEGSFIARETFFIELKIAFPENWKIEGLDIYSIVDVDIWTSLIGGEIVVDTPEIPKKCYIPPLTTDNRKIILEEMGWRDDVDRGDMYVIPRIIFPKDKPSSEVVAMLKTVSRLWPVDSVKMLDNR